MANQSITAPSLTHPGSSGPAPDAPWLLVGNPNVGKSALCGKLTGQYLMVSNYPGTTVTICQRQMAHAGALVMVTDTPGMHELNPFSEEEAVTRDLVLDHGHGARLLLVLDTRNLERGLHLAVQLAELRLHGQVALNLWDEAALAGHLPDCALLARELGVPCQPTVAVNGHGVNELLASTPAPFQTRLRYDPVLEEAITRLSPLLAGIPHLAPRGLAVLALAGAPGFDTWLAKHLPASELARVQAERQYCASQVGQSPRLLLTRRRQHAVTALARQVTDGRQAAVVAPRRLLDRLGMACTHRVLGWLILALVLWLAYQFVGVLGAGVLVDKLENSLFNERLNPLLIRACDWLLPFPHSPVIAEGILTGGYTLTQPLTLPQEGLRLVRDLLVGEYGVFTMALTYGLAIILPVVLTFFLAFGLLEDLGYLSRVSFLLNHAMRPMGLNGAAVLPLVLGLGCDTMATVSTRVLPSTRERLLVTMLLALAVPCSAQLGVIMVMLHQGVGWRGVGLWGVVVMAVLVGAGVLAARILPGKREPLLLELPPLRRPLLSQVVRKTLARLEWYLKEVIPIFVIGGVVLFILDRVGALRWLESAMTPLVVHWLGLPAGAATALLMGFFRRDYGAAGFLALFGAGAMSTTQIVVGVCTITLFVPCLANALVIYKERGWAVGTAIFVGVTGVAFLVGGGLSWLLQCFPGILG